MELCRCSYTIMAILRAKKATNKIKGMTINEIKEIEQTSKFNTIYRKLQDLLSVGFVDYGVKAGKAKTYFLTEKGNNELPEKELPIKNNDELEK